MNDYPHVSKKIIKKVNHGHAFALEVYDWGTLFKNDSKSEKKIRRLDCLFLIKYTQINASYTKEHILIYSNTSKSFRFTCCCWMRTG